MNKIYYVFFIVLISLSGCGTKQVQQIKVKKSSNTFSVSTLEGIDLKVNVNCGEGFQSPAMPSVQYMLSYSVTNLDKDKTFTGRIMEGDVLKSAFISIGISLSNGTTIEKRETMGFIRQVSPNMTSSDQAVHLQVPKGQSVVGIANVKIEYEGNTVPGVHINNLK